MTMPIEEEQNIHNSDIPAVCRSCEARHRGICGALTPDQLIKLNHHTKRLQIDADRELVAVEETVTHYANILNGVVKLSKLMADGRQQIVGLQFAPDFLGRPFQRQNDVTVESAGPVSLCSFPKSVLENLIAESPSLEHKLHEQALRELDDARQLMLMLGRKSASEKVASFLLLLARHADPEADLDKDQLIQYEVPLKRADIADFLGLTIETVSRQLTKLRKAGVISIENNRHIAILSLQRLSAASGDAEI